MKVEVVANTTIMSGYVVRFQTGFDRGTYVDTATRETRTDWSAEVNVSREGVSISGVWPVYESRQNVNRLREILSWACRVHEVLEANLDRQVQVERIEALLVLFKWERGVFEAQASRS